MDYTEQFLKDTKAIREEFRQESPRYTIGAMSNEILTLRTKLNVCEKALRALGVLD